MPIRLEICESNLRSMAAARFNNNASNFQVTKAIKSLPPELREIIYKHYLAIKLRERAALGWDLVHDELSIQPFCSERQRLVHILVCVAYMHCCRGGCCYPCYKQEEIFHELTISVPIYDITLVKYCTDILGEEDHISQIVFTDCDFAVQ